MLGIGQFNYINVIPNSIKESVMGILCSFFYITPTGAQPETPELENPVATRVSGD